MDWQALLQQVISGDMRALARAISLVENEYPGYETLLRALPPSPVRIIGLTGPPGAGKSTLADALIGQLTDKGKRVGIVCVDPSSPFNLGALLGDRIRMSDWYTHPQVFIRSLANRGSMGGLHPKIIEITDLMRAFPFDHLIVETVGVGQSEIEIAGLADTTVVVLVPEAGDEVQTMKAGLMEIADIFVVNKSDRPEADTFVRHLRQMLTPSHERKQEEIPVIQTIASRKKGIDALYASIQEQLDRSQATDRRFWLLAEKAWLLIEQKRMKGVTKKDLKQEIEATFGKGDFNLYTFVQEKV
ncbi:MAG: methylmalonyl Co-A mutase-associated GTPase MeaB [Bacteroidota bacterium]|jgi:LAO/AO transport system kinase